jgi:4-hydroxybenzoate polyprenyltransferase
MKNEGRRLAGGKFRLMGDKLRRIGGKLRRIGEAVIFRHTIFSLPVAASAILLESSGRPSLRKVILILLAAAAGRNAANALNRVIDADIDKKNPRTANRHLPIGLLSKKSLLIFSLVMIIILIVAAALLNPLCVMLLPLAGFLIGGYSYSKRFTWLCHYWLGIACAIAPMGAFIGLSGHFAFRYFILAAAHTLWVAGFDIIYAQMDVEFDLSEDLYSIPACFGPGAGRLFAALSHLGTLFAWFLIPLFWPLSPWYYAAAAVAAALLIAEHLVAGACRFSGNNERRIKIASYSINEIVPIVILAGTAAGVYLK